MRMAHFVTRVLPTVERPSTDVPAVERTCPFLHDTFIMLLLTILLVPTLAAYDRFFDLATIAA